MVKRRSKQKNQEQTYALLLKRRSLFLKLGWTFVVIITILFGYSYGYPVAAAGDVIGGILTGLAYGGGALIVILVSFFLNRKLRGL